MFNLLLLTSLAAITIAMSENQYLVATVLFYTDTKGRVLLASGPVPPTTDDAIKKDVLSRAKDVLVKVVPIYKDEIDIPLNENVVEFVKDKYRTVYVAPVPRRLSRSIMTDMMHYLVRRRLEQCPKVNVTLGSNTTLVVNATVLGNCSNYTNMVSISTKHEDRVWSSPDDYIPNDIYYGIEKRCANWADNCDMNPLDYLNMSSTYFKFLYKPPFVVNWME